MMECRDLIYAIGGKRILNGVNATASRSGITALVGPNGAGKSTILTLLGRLAKPAAGRLILNDRDLSDIPRAEFARLVTTLRQSTRITPRLTVRDLVGFGRYPHNPGKLTDADHEIVGSRLKDLALLELADRHLDTLSGGQQQRALIAMVLAQDTQVLLLDEPLNNLDLAHARNVMELLSKLARSGRVVITVLHDLTIAARFADHVVAVKDGKVQTEGRPEIVFTPDGLCELFGTELEVHTINGKPVILPI